MFHFHFYPDLFLLQEIQPYLKNLLLFMKLRSIFDSKTRAFRIFNS
ncbi:hypothetical protein LEP1GSC068_1350 [Leptospira sp. Fiocruz LV3954]|uniref:Uncharacterized protein n=1 Tax=Leptospira santarosai str. ZUN179 TaxID=1049985 RepID=M6UXR1_9LEPT|nr:hypothetical protein LEP1GSC068_1350 [Leptospira sp. Fiocruz LV3954]EMO45819.1 hypothetical protein LEP1GSC187_2819 [Leptospira santarosai str. ZUN179]